MIRLPVLFIVKMEVSEHDDLALCTSDQSHRSGCSVSVNLELMAVFLELTVGQSGI